MQPFHARAALTCAVFTAACSAAPTNPPTVASSTSPSAGDAHPAALPAIRTNQLGFLPGLAKSAIWVTAESAPHAWELLDARKQVVARGESQRLGPDPASGDSTQLIDFSSLAATGTSFVLRVEQAESDAFSVEPGLYRALARDALRYFYHNRSGIAIELPYAEEKAWARPAGHLPDQGRCGSDTGCNYTLDVSGGWYDAGDQGKYVVNGGLSTWLLLDAFERAKLLGRENELLSDRVLDIPESGNGTPDVLDEARWELEFLLRMQVPEGQALAGMAHHKVHDDNWTSLGTAPHEDTRPRVLRPPSTAATLNLAAVAAQGARIFKPLDASFATRCLAAARRAWDAAKLHPQRLAPSSDSQGGGAYADDVLDDEWYWAAAELFATTGEQRYRSALDAAALDKSLAFPLDGDSRVPLSPVTWSQVDLLGKLTLARAATALPPQRVDAYRQQLRSVGQALLRTARATGYQVPLQPDAQGKVPWGSNSLVLGNMVLLASVSDWFDDEPYVQGVVAGMDYLLGRNPMGQSYVTGYGARPLENPHHRFWAHQANPNYPAPPPGAVSGGPNSDLQDPRAMATLKGCPALKCFTDHIDAYSVNEVAINWNAALAWSALWLHERGSARP
jgi:endoglucanase